MLKGIHPIKKKSYLLDKNTNIHLTTTSILSKYITYDHLKNNANIINNYMKTNKKFTNKKS